MREYIGCPPRAYQVGFILSDPPWVVAAANTAAYVWRPDRPEPVVYAWEETGWGEPILTISLDGRWLVAGPASRLRGWDLTAQGTAKPIDLSVEGELIGRFTTRSDRLTVIYCDSRMLWARELKVATRLRSVRPRSQVLSMPPDVSGDVLGLNAATWRQTTTLSGDGRWLALSAVRRTVHLWDIPSAEPPRAIVLRGSPCAVSLSPDGSRLVLDAGTTVYVHDTVTLGLVSKWKAKYSYVPGLAWSPDGRLLARTDMSTTVRVTDVGTGREVMAVGTKRGVLVSAAFSPDGLTLATGTFEGPVRVWDVE